MRPLLTVLMFVVYGPFAAAQDALPSGRPQFEVAAIRRNVDGTGGNIGVAPGGRLTVKNVPARFMIRL
jgi:hypothetical protein